MNLTGKLPSINVRHGLVYNDKFIFLIIRGTNQKQSFFCRTGFINVKTPGAQGSADSIPDNIVIINYENPAAGKEISGNNRKNNILIGPVKSHFKKERRALPGLTEKRKYPTHLAHEIFRNKQSQTRPAELPGGGTVRLMKSLEKVLLFLHRNTDT